MNLKIRIECSKHDWEKQEEIQLLKEVLKRCGISMTQTDSISGEMAYKLRGKEEKIWDKMTRGAGARATTKQLKIATILEIEEKYKGMPKEKEAALAACEVKLRNYQLIKRNICDCYGDLEKAIRRGHIYFVRVKKTK